MSIKTTKSLHSSEQSHKEPLGSQLKQLMPEGAFLDPSEMLFGFLIENSNLEGASVSMGGRITDPWMNCIIEALIEADDKALESKANNC